MEKIDPYDVLREMTAFAKKHDITISTIGHRAAKDCNVANRIREGFEVNQHKLAQILNWMRSCTKYQGKPPRAGIRADGPAIGMSAADLSDADAAKMGSANLLRALLRYGIRNDRDLSMGFPAFSQRCQEVGLMPAVHSLATSAST